MVQEYGAKYADATLHAPLAPLSVDEALGNNLSEAYASYVTDALFSRYINLFEADFSNFTTYNSEPFPFSLSSIPQNGFPEISGKPLPPSIPNLVINSNHTITQPQPITVAPNGLDPLATNFALLKPASQLKDSTLIIRPGTGLDPAIQPRVIPLVKDKSGAIVIPIDPAKQQVIPPQNNEIRISHFDVDHMPGVLLVLSNTQWPKPGEKLNPLSVNLSAYVTIPPKFTSISPNSLPSGGSELMTVTGTGLSGIKTIIVNPGPNGILVPVSGTPTDTELQFQWPALSPSQPSDYGFEGSDQLCQDVLNCPGVAEHDASLTVHVEANLCTLNPTITSFQPNPSEGGIFDFEFDFCNGFEYNYNIVVTADGRTDKLGPAGNLIDFGNNHYGLFIFVQNYAGILRRNGTEITGPAQMYIEAKHLRPPFETRQSAPISFTIHPGIFG